MGLLDSESDGERDQTHALAQKLGGDRVPSSGSGSQVMKSTLALRAAARQLDNTSVDEVARTIRGICEQCLCTVQEAVPPIRSALEGLCCNCPLRGCIVNCVETCDACMLHAGRGCVEMCFKYYDPDRNTVEGTAYCIHHQVLVHRLGIVS